MQTYIFIRRRQQLHSQQLFIFFLLLHFLFLCTYFSSYSSLLFMFILLPKRKRIRSRVKQGDAYSSRPLPPHHSPSSFSLSSPSRSLYSISTPSSLPPVPLVSPFTAPPSAPPVAYWCKRKRRSGSRQMVHSDLQCMATADVHPHGSHLSLNGRRESRFSSTTLLVSTSYSSVSRINTRLISWLFGGWYSVYIVALWSISLSPNPTRYKPLPIMYIM